MQLDNQDLSVSLARFQNAPGLLVIFVVVSLLVHASTLILTTASKVQTPDQRYGTTIISTKLVTVSNKNEIISETTVTTKATDQHNTAKTTKPVIANNQHTKELATTVNSSDNAQTVSKIASTDLQMDAEAPDQNAFRTQTQAAETPTPGSETLTNQKEQQRNYLLGELNNRLSKYLTYPVRARRYGWQGKVTIAFHINKHGQLNKLRLEKSSGYTLLDHSALSAITKLKHISLPANLGTLHAMDMLLPVSYELHES